MKRPAFGHLLGYTALTVILTAGAAQSLAGSNTVTSDDIVDGTIVANDIKTAAIGGRPIVDNSITGADVNESTLVLTCPSGMTLAHDVCYGSKRNAASWTAAFFDCSDEGLRLPTPSEGEFAFAPGDFDQIWTDLYYEIGTAYRAMGVNASGLIPYDPSTAALKYRCFTSVGAHP